MFFSPKASGGNQTKFNIKGAVPSNRNMDFMPSNMNGKKDNFANTQPAFKMMGEETEENESQKYILKTYDLHQQRYSKKDMNGMP